jgi:hypothetical protein
LSREATAPYIAKTVSDPERETAAVEEGVAIAVNWGRHFIRKAAIWREQR